MTVSFFAAANAWLMLIDTCTRDCQAICVISLERHEGRGKCNNTIRNGYAQMSMDKNRESRTRRLTRRFMPAVSYARNLYIKVIFPVASDVDWVAWVGGWVGPKAPAAI